jgi:hypothetical protein
MVKTKYDISETEFDLLVSKDDFPKAPSREYRDIMVFEMVLQEYLQNYIKYRKQFATT